MLLPPRADGDREEIGFHAVGYKCFESVYDVLVAFPGGGRLLATSLPAEGSVTARAASLSPASTGSATRSFICLSPKAMIGGSAILCTMSGKQPAGSSAAQLLTDH